MKRTALNIIQEVLQRVNLPYPTALVGSTDPATLQYIQVLYAVCEELRQVGAWTEQKRKYTFQTVAGVSQYQLPTDYYSPLLNTHWNDSEADVLVGPISDEEFAYYLKSGNSPSQNYFYRLFGWDNNSNSELGQFEITPTPTAAQTLSFEYLTRHLFLPMNWLPSTAYTTANYVNVNGNIYKCTVNGTSSASNPPSGTDASGIVDGTAQWGYYNTPYQLINADTDLCLFPYDLVKLGFRAKWSGEKNGDIYSQAAEQEYNSKIKKARARLKGNFIGSFARQRMTPNYSFPYKNWSI